jgi:uncharacterized membrane protein
MWKRGQVVREGGVAVVATVALSGLLAHFGDFGASAGNEFYAAIVQVIPVFLVALLLEVAVQFPVSESTRPNVRQEKAELANAIAQAARVRESVSQDRQRAEAAGGTFSRELEQAAQEYIASTDEVVTSSRKILDTSEQLVNLYGAIRAIVFSYVAAAVPGEAAALYALAAGESSTFLLSLSVLSLISMVLLFVVAFSRRYGASQ